MKDNNTAKLKGINALHGADIYASDLRAGASLIVAGLAASGTTNVHNIQFIDRGYEYLDDKLSGLGARLSGGKIARPIAQYFLGRYSAGKR